jgi:PAS domain S-box-containing protein
MAMKKQEDHPIQSADLRWRAETLARRKVANSLPDLEGMSPEAMRQTVHELRVHQIELEMQNDELHRVQEKLEDARSRYFDLYDLAPVGHCILSMDGLILEANLAAADLLGEAQATLIKQPITRFILNADQDIYYLYRKRFLQTGEPDACDLRLRKHDGTAFWAHLATTTARGLWVGPGQASDRMPVYRMVMSDITERKGIEGALKRERSLLRMAQELGRIGSWEWDPGDQIMSWTEETYRLFGCQPSGPRPGPEPPTRSLEWFLPADRPVMESAFRRCVEQGAPFNLKFNIINAKGRQLWIHTMGEPELEDGNVIGAVGIIMETADPQAPEPLPGPA